MKHENDKENIIITFENSAKRFAKRFPHATDIGGRASAVKIMALLAPQCTERGWSVGHQFGTTRAFRAVAHLIGGFH
jgi:hypothetical protein